ncbi:MAG: hypothetical protein K6G88_02575 [Lachnospiraceae bacterium]|jgi:hypothetical protein|nr:hypothetical protein [Lachnospiraceae bacterium]
MDTVNICFHNLNNNFHQELEVPLGLTANELIVSLNQAYHLGIDTEDIFECYLVAENPIVFLKGNKTLEAFGIRNSTDIIFKR